MYFIICLKFCHIVEVETDLEDHVVGTRVADQEAVTGVDDQEAVTAEIINTETRVLKGAVKESEKLKL